MKIKNVLGLAVALAVVLPASAGVVTLTFEGIATTGTAVGSYYDGGVGGDYGISFTNAIADVMIPPTWRTSRCRETPS